MIFEETRRWSEIGQIKPNETDQREIKLLEQFFFWQEASNVEKWSKVWGKKERRREGERERGKKQKRHLALARTRFWGSRSYQQPKPWP